jgi:hypothetical protein
MDNANEVTVLITKFVCLKFSMKTWEWWSCGQTDRQTGTQDAYPKAERYSFQHVLCNAYGQCCSELCFHFHNYHHEWDVDHTIQFKDQMPFCPVVVHWFTTSEEISYCKCRENDDCNYVGCWWHHLHTACSEGHYHYKKQLLSSTYVQVPPYLCNMNIQIS